MRKKMLETKEYTYSERSEEKGSDRREGSYMAMYEPAKEGGYSVVAPSLAGLVTYGRTFEETREMVRDAIRCHLEA